MECIKDFYFNNLDIVKIKWIEVTSITSYVLNHTFIFFFQGTTNIQVIEVS
jgi:hypothetical protein